MNYGHGEEVFDLSLKIISYCQAAWLAITLVVFYSLAKKASVNRIA